jgi:hypothetical protein
VALETRVKSVGIGEPSRWDGEGSVIGRKPQGSRNA